MARPFSTNRTKPDQATTNWPIAVIGGYYFSAQFTDFKHTSPATKKHSGKHYYALSLQSVLYHQVTASCVLVELILLVCSKAQRSKKSVNTSVDLGWLLRCWLSKCRGTNHRKSIFPKIFIDLSFQINLG